MSNQISPLRQRMIDDMTIRNMSPSTQKIMRADLTIALVQQILPQRRAGVLLLRQAAALQLGHHVIDELLQVARRGEATRQHE